MPNVPIQGVVDSVLVLMDPTGKFVAGQADSSGNLITSSSGGTIAATVTQGSAAALAGAWPVQVTDLTHTMPTGDAQSRAVQVQPGDGTNATPAGDVAARGRFQKVTDGTNTAAVKAASTAPIATDPALVVAISPNTPSFPVAATVTGVGASAAAADGVTNPTLGLLQSMLSVFNGTTWDRARSGLVAVQTTFTGLLNTISMGRYNATAPTLADGNVAPVQLTSAGSMRTAQVDVVTTILDLTTTTSSSASTTTVSATVSGLSNALSVAVEATLQGNTGGVLDIYLQHSPNSGTDWYDWAHWTQLAAAAAATTQWYVPAMTNTNTVIGKGTAGTPAVALAANTFVGGHPLDSVRMVMVTGSGTTLGKSQVVKLHITQPRA